MTRWTGLAPWQFELSIPGSLVSTFLACPGGLIQRVFFGVQGANTELFSFDRENIARSATRNPKPYTLNLEPKTLGAGRGGNARAGAASAAAHRHCTADVYRGNPYRKVTL